mgnify:CR=1 FL=1|tara:strand:+ start:3849 stop:4379 length:531 start_codon:yes stop_codon:yes gene_type:complete
MTKDYSADAFFRFMDMVKDKGLLNPNTAQSRKAAGNKMLALLEPDEKQDLREIDLDHLHERFANKSGTDYTPNSLQVYKSRFKSALDDFVSWVDNPSAFRPSTSKRESAPRQNSKPKSRKPSSTVAEPPGRSSPDDFPIYVPIREDVVVQITGVPADLTDKEAGKIAAVIQAYAQK